MITLSEVQGAWFFFYRKGDVIMEELDILRYNDFKSFQSITEENLSLQSEKRKTFIAQEDCVACGCCVNVCPIGAVQIMKGIMAQVNMDKCVGCGKCAKEFPTGVIEIREVGA